jgi:hypothetical protein
MCETSAGRELYEEASAGVDEDSKARKRWQHGDDKCFSNDHLS